MKRRLLLQRIHALRHGAPPSVAQAPPATLALPAPLRELAFGVFDHEEALAAQDASQRTREAWKGWDATEVVAELQPWPAATGEGVLGSYVATSAESVAGTLQEAFPEPASIEDAPLVVEIVEASSVALARPLTAPPEPPYASAATVRAQMLKGRSESTWRAYESDLRHFVDRHPLRALGDTAVLDAFLLNAEVAQEQARAWLQEMRERGLSAATCQRRVAGLRAFVEAARALGRVSWSLDLTVPMVDRTDSLHRRVVSQLVEDRLAAEPELAARLVALMRSGWPRHITDFVTQKRQRLDLYDAFVLVDVQTLLERGDLVLLRIPVGATPEADRCVTANRAALQRLPAPFRAELNVARNDDSDGLLSWDTAILGNVVVAAGSAPLEVGTTASTRTFLHLYERDALARWCYEDDCLTLCVRGITVTTPAVEVSNVSGLASPVIHV